MSRSATALLAASALAASALTTVVATAPAQARSSTGAEAVRSWNAVTMTSLGTAGIAIPEQPLYLAYVHQAVYDGVRRASSRHDAASVPAAVTAAAYGVLSAHFGTAQSAYLRTQYDASMSTLPDDHGRRAGARIGERAAARVVRERADDGLNGTPLAPPAAGVGVWSPAVPGAPGVSSWLGKVRPFVLTSADELRPPPPPALGSRRYARDYAEVQSYGGAVAARTADQTVAAKFWSDPPYVQNQQGLRKYSSDAGLDALATARLFALADTAAADALIACFDAKYHYLLWRPLRAIPAGDSDGNPATRGDPAWKPLLAVTPNHPEYPSAHSCATTALATVLGADTNGQLDLDLSSTTTGTTRHFSSVGQLVTEVSNARVWGGVHWRFSTRVGEAIGRAVGERVLAQDRRTCR